MKIVMHLKVDDDVPKAVWIKLKNSSKDAKSKTETSQF